MDSYAVDELTEEVFGHLCNIALDKCRDKSERRRAGCGGKAMRKRVLIKNFVSDLLKHHNDRSSDEEGNNQTEINEADDLDTSNCEDEEMDVQCNDSSLMGICDQPRSDKGWMCSENEPPTPYHDIMLSDSMLSGRDGAVGRASMKSSSELDCRISMYDLYSGVSEAAPEGERRSAAEPLPTNTDYSVPATANYDSCGMYESALSGRYEMDSMSMCPLSIASLCETDAPLQPVRAEASDQLFLSLSNHRYSEMKTYANYSTPMNCVMPDDVMAPPEYSSLTDLDAPHNAPAILLSPKKRRSDETEFSLYDTINAQVGFHKRIKL